MTLPIFSTVIIVLILVLCLVLILCTTPKRNEIKDNALTTTYILGNSTTLNLSSAQVIPVPNDADAHLMRVGGTSVCGRHSGRYKNIKTGNYYYLLITGKGSRIAYVVEGKTYIIDGIN